MHVVDSGDQGLFSASGDLPAFACPTDGAAQFSQRPAMTSGAICWRRTFLVPDQEEEESAMPLQPQMAHWVANFSSHDQCRPRWRNSSDGIRGKR